MPAGPRRLVLSIILGAALLAPPQIHAQLDKAFSNVFTEILDVRLQRSGSPGQHGTHFLESASRANSELVPGLNSLIAGNVASFPLSSTSTGALFDFSGGEPVLVAQSAGPIFAETAQSLGAGKVFIEATYTYLDLSRFRGMPTDQMRFTFTHKDVTNDGSLGQSPNESDLIDLFLDLHARAGIGAIFATYGLTEKLDISVAVPVISVWLRGTARAEIQSYTFGRLGHANHLFGGDTLHPVLTTEVPYDQSATGIGDIPLRIKYSFASGGALDAAALLDVRFPTGKKEDFLGSGKMAVRLWAILSHRIGDVTPHLNLGYARRAAALQSDGLEYRAGFDSKFLSNVTLALDLLGHVDLNADKAVHLAPGSVTIMDLAPGASSVRTVPLSNIPDATSDNTVSLSAGMRVAPSASFNLFGNILVPLNNAGLRAPLAVTAGASLGF